MFFHHKWDTVWEIKLSEYKKQKKKIPIQTQKKKWTTFTYHSSLIHKVTDLFKNTNLNTAFRHRQHPPYKSIYNKSPQNKMNASGIYRLHCKTCNKSCWSNWKSIKIRHREHVRYIKTNNSLSAYALHILNNRHEYGNPKRTIQLLQACRKGKIMNCWEYFYIQVLQQQNLLIEEQKAYVPGKHSCNTNTLVSPS